MPRGPFWKEKEIARLKDHYPFISGKDLTKAFPGRSVRGITTMANRRGLQKCQERLREMGRENRYGCKDDGGPSSAA